MLASFPWLPKLALQVHQVRVLLCCLCQPRLKLLLPSPALPIFSCLALPFSIFFLALPLLCSWCSWTPPLLHQLVLSSATFS